MQSPVPGALFMSTQGGVLATSLPITSAKGESCATTILGLVGTGDASIKTAAASAGITRVAAVDHTSFNILGVFGKYCTVVYGHKGKGAAKAAPAKAEGASSSSEDEF